MTPSLIYIVTESTETRGETDQETIIGAFTSEEAARSSCLTYDTSGLDALAIYAYPMDVGLDPTASKGIDYQIARYVVHTIDYGFRDRRWREVDPRGSRRFQ